MTIRTFCVAIRWCVFFKKNCKLIALISDKILTLQRNNDMMITYMAHKFWWRRL